MSELCFLAMVFAIILALVVVLVVVLKDGKFSFSLRKEPKKDALLVKTEHRRLDK